MSETADAKQHSDYFRNPLAEFIYYRTYSRWIEEKNRRETWPETVERYISFMRTNLGNKLGEGEYEKLQYMILHQMVMPSMRLMWTAGKMAESENMSAFNCTFTAIESAHDLAEILYILMCGTGVGFSVERSLVDKFPPVKFMENGPAETFVIEDSRRGWAEALEFGLTHWLSGVDVCFDFSKLRPRGSRLKTMGGRSSGPAPLMDLLSFARRKILSRQGEKLSPLDVHDIACKIGECIVAGGVRRSALISLSDLDDKQMRDSKIGKFWEEEPQRMMANNSAIYSTKPTREQFEEEWDALRKSGSGERGIFYRGGCAAQFPSRREFSDKYHYGTNPCGEINLRSKQMCNLTEVVARSWDSMNILEEKIWAATVLGTFQSSLTNFGFISSEWAKNGEDERLLGVSLTGIWDCPILNHPRILDDLRKLAINTNKEYAERFGIKPSKAITCVKPSGTVSQLVDSSSGMHARYAPYYIRRVRIAVSDPLFALLRASGMKAVPEVGQDASTASTWVLEFPVKAPEGVACKNDLSALEQLEHWKLFKEHYTEHNPSVTISVGEDEWDVVRDWVYENWESIGGLSFLPRYEHVYELAPYEEISAKEYIDMLYNMPEIDYSKLTEFELEDATQGSRELACVGGKCAI